MIQTINKINWILSLLLLLSVIPVYFNKVIFLPSLEILQPSKIISVIFILNVVYFSIYSRLIIKRTRIGNRRFFKTKLNGKPIFTDNAHKQFSEEFRSPIVTFFMIPFFAIFAGVSLLITLSITAPAIYTNYSGKYDFKETKVLDKRQHGKLNNKYSIKLSGFDKSLEIPRSDFLNLEVNENIKLEGKITKFGFLISKFTKL